MKKEYRIHPSVGIARMGTSKNCFIGPEAPTLSFVPEPDGKYRDSNDELKPQAQRFRIYELTFEEGSDTPSQVREITSNEAEIRWSVHVVNKKSFERSEAQRIPIDPKPTTLDFKEKSAKAEGDIWGSTVCLANLELDEDGRLLVVGPSGETGKLASSPLSGLHNKGWWDDAADGPVTASLCFPDSAEPITAEPAWIVVSLPAYAAPIESVVTLYDLARDHAFRAGRVSKPTPLSFTHDIFPILRRAVDLQWASEDARRGHASGDGNFLNRIEELASDDPDRKSERKDIWDELKKSGGNMPDLSYLSLTSLQYEIMTDWKDGNFLSDWNGKPVYPDFDKIPVPHQPAALNRAALESMSGGSFRPGIEVCNVVEQATAWGPDFRISSVLQPGDLTRELAVPWQADFQLCGTGWWPASRPNNVSNDGQNFYKWLDMTVDDLLTKWPDLGFLKRQENGQVIEDERQI